MKHVHKKWVSYFREVMLAQELRFPLPAGECYNPVLLVETALSLPVPMPGFFLLSGKTL